MTTEKKTDDIRAQDGSRSAEAESEMDDQCYLDDCEECQTDTCCETICCCCC